MTVDALLIDPDCRDGKHRSCVGGPCECWCHIRDQINSDVTDAS